MRQVLNRKKNNLLSVVAQLNPPTKSFLQQQRKTKDKISNKFTKRASVISQSLAKETCQDAKRRRQFICKSVQLEKRNFLGDEKLLINIFKIATSWTKKFRTKH